MNLLFKKMNQEARFKALSQDQKFQFLYYAGNENKTFLLSWFKGQFLGSSSVDECTNTIENSFDFLKKLFFPGIDPELILEKEIMLNGMADDILTLSDEVADMQTCKNQNRAVAVLNSIECLYTTLIDCYFSSEDNDVDKNAFHVILLCAIGNHLYADYEELTRQINYKTSWKDLDVLALIYPEVKDMLEEFMENMLGRFTLADH